MKLSLNGEPTELGDGTTISALVDQLGGGSKGVAVAVNGEVVTRGRWGETLAEGDRVEVLRAVGGG